MRKRVIQIRKKSVFIILIVCIIIGGYFALGEYKKSRLVKEAQRKTETFLHDNYDDIYEVQVNNDNTYFDPLGGLSIGGYVNDNNDLYFNIRFTITNEKVGNVTSVFTPPNFPPGKEECIDNFCE